MAKAVGGARHVGYQGQPFDVANLAELGGRLEQLEKAQEAARAVALGDDPDYATAFSQLFAAV
ncbi:MAG TPA: hypothetical protein VEH29_05855, partial [Acidimicrobiales bacterium]|nr:hypothetical protein [Acidimicrobiales bacterium]